MDAVPATLSIDSIDIILMCLHVSTEINPG
jgi:hypothetical protein